jgi:hypothetical protein
MAQRPEKWRLGSDDLWNVDPPIADDMLTVVRLIRDSRSFPDALGFGDEIAAVWGLFT